MIAIIVTGYIFAAFYAWTLLRAADKPEPGQLTDAGRERIRAAIRDGMK